MSKVCVVVPVYNVENYVDKCIQSIIAQRYRDFRLILVNDGSTDSSGMICDNFAKKDPRITVIHKKNGGLSDARNTGIKIAQEEYITFIDSDDIISDDYLESLVSAAASTRSDIVQGQFCRELSFLGKKEDIPDIQSFSGNDAFRELLMWGKIEVYAPGKLYKTKLFSHILYPIGKINEDCFTTYKLLLESDRVTAIPNIIYFYRTTPDSILNREFYYKRFELWNCPQEMEMYLGNNAKNYKDELQYFKIRIGINLINDSVGSSDPRIIEYRDKIIESLRRITLKNRLLSRKYLLLLLILKINKGFYNYLARERRK